MRKTDVFVKQIKYVNLSQQNTKYNHEPENEHNASRLKRQGH